MTINKGVIANGEERSMRLDKMTHAGIIIDYSHHEIHDGSHYMAGVSDQLATAGDHIDIAMATPGWTPSGNDNYDTTYHVQLHVWGSAGFSTILKKDVVSISGGTVITPFNNNMNDEYHSKTSSLDITAGSLTVNGGTTAFGPLYRGARAESSEGRSDNEIILKPASITVLTLTLLANGAANVGIRASWYETTPKH